MTIKLVSEEGPMGASMIAPPTGLKGGSVPVAGLAELGLCIGFGIHSQVHRNSGITNSQPSFGRAEMCEIC